MKKRVVIRVIEYVVMAILGLFLFKNVWNFIDVKSGYKAPFFGYRSLNVVSGSMSYVDNTNKERLAGVTNQIQKGDLVRTTTNFTFESLQTHDIVTFQKDGLQYCHRIVFKDIRNGVQGLVTQGDANGVTDGFIPMENVNGKVYQIVPGLGKVMGFLSSGYFTAAIFVAAGCVFGGLLIIDYGEYHKFNILADYNKKLQEDQTVFLNHDEYDKAKGKGKKAFALNGADNHYVVSCSKNQLILTRYIRTDYKTNDKIVSGEFKEKPLEETILSSALEFVQTSKKPVSIKKIQKILKTKGLVLSAEDAAKVNAAIEKKGAK